MKDILEQVEAVDNDHQLVQMWKQMLTVQVLPGNSTHKKILIPYRPILDQSMSDFVC